VKAAKAMDMILKEYSEASNQYGAFSSAHEGYAVLQEEVEELWDEVKKKPSARSKEAMLSEAGQVAAMAMRFMVDICLDDD